MISCSIQYRLINDMIHGLSHITLIVKDIERTAELFRNLFGAREVYSSGEKQYSISKEKFFIIDDSWFAIMEGDPSRDRTYNHIAFRISEKDLDSYIQKITDLGLETRNGRNRVPGEGKSVYFYDYDNHLFELHTGSLEERLEHYNK